MSEELNKNGEAESKKGSVDEDINAFLDSLTTESGIADDFLDKLYDDSFSNLTSDFDTLLKEFQSIDPDDVEGSPEETAASAQPEQEMEDIFSYSDQEEDDRQEKKFSEAVQEAMEAEMGDGDSGMADMGDTFRLSLDNMEGDDFGFGNAMQDAASPSDAVASGATQVYSADAVRKAAQPKAQQRRPVQQSVPQQGQKKQPAKKKKKNSLLPTKNDSTLEIFRKVLFLVSIFVVVICIGIIGNTYLLQPQLEKQRQGKLTELGQMSESDFQAKYGDLELPAGMSNMNLAQFYGANKDFYGYLEIKGLGISTPVVQGTDNKKYLRQNFFGESTKYGCPFVNYKNTYAALDHNTSIFGHNMEYDNLVFGELEQYRTIDGFKKAPVIHLETMYNDYNFKVYAVFLTDSAYDNDGWYFDYIFTQLKDEQEKQEYIDQLNQRRLYSTGVDIQPSDKLLTLSTCAYDFSTERLVVVGRLVREGESTDVDTSKALASSNPRYPAKYYQKKGMSNPYASAEKWIPNT